MKSQQSGRSMMEMLGVLSIIGVLSVGSMSGFSKMMMQQKINKTIEQVTAMAAKLSQIGAQSGFYDGLNNKTAARFGAVPSSLMVSGGDDNLENNFGGNVTISGSNLLEGEDDKQAYLIVYEGIPQDACIAIASHAWMNGINSSFVGIGASDSALNVATIKDKLYQDCTNSSSANYAVVCNGNNPMDPGTATLACGCSSGDTCVIVWKYF